MRNPQTRPWKPLLPPFAVDKKLYQYDIDGSIAHCRMLAKCGIITAEEADALTGGLEKIRQEITSGDFVFSDRLEDIHMHIEDRLAAHVGNVSRKLHTGRSRNDQVALDIRLYLRDMSRKIIYGLVQAPEILVDMAETHIDVSCPDIPICSGPARAFFPIICWPTMKCSPGIPSDFQKGFPGSTSCHWVRPPLRHHVSH